MRKIAIILGMLCLSFRAMSINDVTVDDTIPKPKYWKFSGIVGLNISQTGLWNWTGGGNNNGNAYVLANVLLTYKKDKLAWETNFDTEYGWMYTSDTYFGSQYSDLDTKYPFRKSNDKIILSTKLGYEFVKSWFLTIAGSFKSQYDKGYDYIREYDDVKHELYEHKTLISNILSPSYTDMSLGIDWKALGIFSLYMSPVGGRVTSCLIDSLKARYHVDSAKTYLAQFGLTLKGQINYTYKNLKIITAVTLFTPYRFNYKANKALPYMDPKRNQTFGNFDVDWDFSISYTFLKVLSVSLNTTLKYRDQEFMTYRYKGDPKGFFRTGQRVQFREIVALGVGYRF